MSSFSFHSYAQNTIIILVTKMCAVLLSVKEIVTAFWQSKEKSLGWLHSRTALMPSVVSNCISSKRNLGLDEWQAVDRWAGLACGGPSMEAIPCTWNWLCHSLTVNARIQPRTEVIWCLGSHYPAQGASLRSRNLVERKLQLMPPPATKCPDPWGAPQAKWYKKVKKQDQSWAPLM